MGNYISELSGSKNDWWKEILNHSMRLELQRVKHKSDKAQRMCKFIGELSNLNSSGNTRRKRELREIFSSWGIAEGLVSDEALKHGYQDICGIINRRFGFSESFCTHHEELFALVFKNNSKRKILPACWIGNCCVDLYVPTVRVDHFVGLAIELDGSIHFTKHKIAKDEFKDDYLFRLNIFPKHIWNYQIHDERICQEIKTLNSTTADSNSVRNKWRRIYIETIAHHADEKFYSDWLGVESEKLLSLAH